MLTAGAVRLIACRIFPFFLPISTALAADSGSPLQGEYLNADEKAIIEFLPKGKAFLSFHGLTQECTHKGSGKTVILTCDGEDTRFTVSDDGTLAGPPDSFLVRMKKKK